MIPAAFEYVKAESVEAAIAALAEHGDEAKLIAGGHSLLPLMRIRLATPAVLVDIGALEALRGVRDAGDHLAIGAGTTHYELCRDPLVAEHCGVLAEVTQTVGDPQVRHRGTIGGAAAHGDAAGDQPTALLALDATFVCQGPGGRREVAATDFFTGVFETALAPDELLTEIQVAKLGEGWSGSYQKFSRVAQAWAIVGVCAVARRENGTVAEARVGLTHMGSTPLRASATEAAVAGAEASDDGLKAAADQAAEGTEPPADQNAQPDYRRHLARVLTHRALSGAAGV